MPRILLVDDEPDIIEVLELVLQNEGMEVLRASSGHKALSILRETPVDMVISDIRMPDLSGVELLKEAKQFAPNTIFIMITAYASTETAIDALQHGAYDYLTKPFKMDELRTIVRDAFEKQSTRDQLAPVKEDLEALQGQKLFQALHRTQIVGKSPRMLEIYRTIGTIAMADSTVLITGESGTGKELIARAIHGASPRKDGPFVSINCGAFPESLLESELFGYMKGAFTGATSNKKGLFLQAGEGSIFLDEIGEMTPAMQVKVLRALQERVIRPLGSTSEVPVDVRVIAATNRDLKSAIRSGHFREDLYYRIAVITIHLPALRERVEDIGLLAIHFLRHYAEKAGRKVVGISPEALCYLESYRWPGNVRELENAIERAVALETADAIQVDRLPEAILRNEPLSVPQSPLDLPEEPFDLQSFLTEVESSLICRALKNANGNQTQAARQLKLTKGSLRHRIQALRIEPCHYRRGLPAEAPDAEDGEPDASQ